MTSTLAIPLFKAAASTFEDLALLFPSRELDELQREASLDVAVAVAFSGPFGGRLEVRVSAALLPVIAANMLGDDTAHDDQTARDAVGELANVICGNVLPAIAGSREVFHLEAPRGIDVAPAPGLPPAATADIGLDESRAEVRLYVDGDVA
jgi:CheY-specific phosphatase CheX